MEFSSQEYWRGLPFPSPGDLPDPGIQSRSPALVDGFFTSEPQGECSCQARIGENLVRAKGGLSREKAREFQNNIHFCFLGGLGYKEPAHDVGNLDLISGLGRSLGEGNGSPLQYPCLDNSMDREACWAAVHGIAKEDRTEWLTLSLFCFIDYT